MNINLHEKFYVKEELQDELTRQRIKKGSIITIQSYNTNTGYFKIFDPSRNQSYMINENQLNNLIEVAKSAK